MTYSSREAERLQALADDARVELRRAEIGKASEPDPSEEPGGPDVLRERARDLQRQADEAWATFKSTVPFYCQFPTHPRPRIPIRNELGYSLTVTQEPRPDYKGDDYDPSIALESHVYGTVCEACLSALQAETKDPRPGVMQRLSFHSITLRAEEVSA